MGRTSRMSHVSRKMWEPVDFRCGLFGAETMGGLDQSHQQGRANRSHTRNLPQLGGDGMLATFYQQFPPHLLPQPLQEIQVLVEMFGSPADSGMLDLF